MTAVLGVTEGGAVTATTCPITLPAGYATAGRILLWVSRGAAWATALTADSGVVLTEIVLPVTQWARAFWVTSPAATFTVSSSVNATWGWGCLTLGDCLDDVVDAGMANDTTSLITFQTPTCAATADLAIAMASTNASAVWTGATGGTQRVARNTQPGAFLLTTPITGTVTPMSVDRGNAGINRRESWVTLVVKPTATPPTGGRPKAYVAGSWQKKPGKVWTGSAWVEKPWKRWDGTTWKTLT